MDIFIVKSQVSPLIAQEFYVTFRHRDSKTGKIKHLGFTIPEGEITAIWERKKRRFDKMPYVKI